MSLPNYTFEEMLLVEALIIDPRVFFIGGVYDFFEFSLLPKLVERKKKVILNKKSEILFSENILGVDYMNFYKAGEILQKLQKRNLLHLSALGEKSGSVGLSNLLYDSTTALSQKESVALLSNEFSLLKRILFLNNTRSESINSVYSFALVKKEDSIKINKFSLSLKNDLDMNAKEVSLG